MREEALYFKGFCRGIVTLVGPFPKKMAARFQRAAIHFPN
jgi:hypothetical protein